MEHTKGKVVVSQIYDDGSVHLHGGKNKDYICSIQIKQIGGGAIAEVMETARMANAEHLVKCWNEYDKLQQELADYKEGCEGLKLTVQDFNQQRDDLLAACRAWEKFISNLPKDFKLQVFLYHLFNEAKELTEQAIAKAKPSQ